jgi:hypothetical protein
VAFVREEVEDAKLGLMQRTLWVRESVSGSVEHEVARGSSKLHAVWIDDDHLLYDVEPAMTRAWTAKYVAPALATEEDVADALGQVDPAFRDILVRAHINEVNALRTWEAESNAIVALQEEQVDVAALQEEQLAVFDVRTKTSTALVLAGQRHARLFAQPRRANLRGDDLNIEVRPLPPRPLKE